VSLAHTVQCFNMANVHRLEMTEEVDDERWKLRTPPGEEGRGGDLFLLCLFEDLGVTLGEPREERRHPHPGGGGWSQVGRKPVLPRDASRRGQVCCAIPAAANPTGDRGNATVAPPSWTTV